MRIILVFGFLGSGKTTLVRRLIEQSENEVPSAVIVNEFGEIGIDGEILRGTNVDVKEINSGCVCCTMKGSFLLAIRELRARNGIERVIVEATGVAQPADLIEPVRATSGGFIESCRAVTVVDAGKFGKLQRMLGEFYLAQVQHADVVILNKVDMAGAEELDRVRRRVRQLNRNALTLEAEHCDVDFSSVLNSSRSTPFASSLRTDDRWRRELEGSQHATLRKARDDPGAGQDHALPEIESFVLSAAGNYDVSSVRLFFDSLPHTVWRAKGFMAIDGRSMLVQYVGGELNLAPAAPRASKSLVFIGKDMDRLEIERLFMNLPETWDGEPILDSGSANEQ
jgi:G3E family GTPase